MGKHSYGGIQIVGTGEIVIGNFCSIADNVRAYFYFGHRTDWVTTYPFPAIEIKTGNGTWESARGIEGYETKSGQIIIGNDVWIGANVTILDGVFVGDGACIGAHSIVAKDIPPYAMVAGNSARIIKFRFTPEQISDLLNIAWWNWEDEKIEKYVPLLCSNNMGMFIKKAMEEN
jgi:acetyltransferase-like isoleucine patch superfamily enzyme